MLKRKWVLGTIATSVLLVAMLLGITLTPRISNNQVVVTIGMSSAEASSTPDYICDGVDDNVQFQGAINALPAAGGKLIVLGGTYSFSATVTRAIDNVEIVGVGQGTYITYNGVNPVFTAGGNNWKFEDIRTDAGSINLGATTGYVLTNVLLGATYYGFNSQAGSIQGGAFTGTSFTDSGLTSGRLVVAGVGGLLGDSANLSFASGTTTLTTANITTLNAPTGRTATYVIAASDAPATVKAQADLVSSASADIQTVLNALNATGVHSILELIGNFTGTTELDAVSNVDVFGKYQITITSNGGINGLHFNNTTNTIWSDGTIIRAGNTGASGIIQAILIDGTSDATTKLYRMIGNNTATSGAVDQTWGINILTRNGASPYLEECIGYGSTAGTNNQAGGIQVAGSLSTGGGYPVLVRVKGIGGGDGSSNANWGVEFTEANQAVAIDLIGIATSGDGSAGIDVDGCSVTLINPRGYAADGFVNTVGINFREGGSAIINNPEAVAGVGTGSTGMQISQGSSPIINGGILHPKIESKEIQASDNTSFKISTVYQSSFWRGMYINVAGGYAETLDIGTTLGGHEIAQSISLTTNIEVPYTNQIIAANASVYLTFSNPVAGINIMYSVVYTKTGSFNAGLTIGATASSFIITGTQIFGALSDGQDPAISLQSVVNPTWKIKDSWVETNGNYAVMSNILLPLAPFYNTKLVGTVLNITSFAGDESGNRITQILQDREVNLQTSTGWTEVLTGSGATSVLNNGINLETGTTVNSTALRYLQLYPWGGNGMSYPRLDWTKKLVIDFDLTKQSNEANGTGRVQVKTANTIGAMADYGIGLRIDNYALKGESYGSGLGIVDLASNITDAQITHITIISYPGAKIEWYVDGVIKGTQTDVNKIPTSNSEPYFVMSVETITSNPSANVIMRVYFPKIWQLR